LSILWERNCDYRGIGGERGMNLFGLALLSVLLGAAGSEILRATKPDLVQKIEVLAKRFVKSFSGSESDAEEPKKE